MSPEASYQGPVGRQIAKIVQENLLAQGECFWERVPKSECGCEDVCPNCGRKGHDPTVPKCYLC